MATFSRFEDIEAWQLARETARRVFDVSAQRSFSRDSALRNQMRRAATSAMSNIAEGFERDGSREFRQFLAISKGSVGELLSHLYVARDQGFLAEAEFEEIAALIRRTGAALGSLIRYLGESSLDGRKFISRNQRPETRDQKP